MKEEVNNPMSITAKQFSQPDSQSFEHYYLSNGNMKVVIGNYGCTIISVSVPDRNGVKENVVAGFSEPHLYLKNHPYLGCIVGRYANRIAFGKFEISGKKYSLPINDKMNHLHGGIDGFHRKFWDLKNVTNDEKKVAVTFGYYSVDGEEGYPGNLMVNVSYTLTIDNQLIIRYKAQTDQPTIVNLTNHSYFNLSGFKNPKIHDHLLRVYASGYTEKNCSNIPTGRILAVKGTPFDFLNFKPIGKDIQKLKEDKGYDINFVLNKQPKQIALVAELSEPTSGRVVKLFTNKPGLQVYTSNWWDGTLRGSQDVPYIQHGAIALETQSFPDSPNHLDFPNSVLLPGELYETETCYQFLSQ